jgi:hypothetical protein
VTHQWVSNLLTAGKFGGEYCDRSSKQANTTLVSIRGQGIVYFDRELQNDATTKVFAINQYHFQTPKQNHEVTV